jgi:hypothetical protein
MNDFLYYGLFIIQIIVYMIVFFIQREQIKSIKSKFENAEKFMNIFNIDTVNEYVDLSTKKERLSAFMQVKRQYQDHEAQFGSEYNELFNVVVALLYAIPKKEDREEFIDEYLPHSANRIRVTVGDKSIDELDNSLEQKLSDYLKGN